MSLSTVRTHTQHIYTKLGVTNRRAAVRRAHQLNLCRHTSSPEPKFISPSSQVMTCAHHLGS